jgi:tRNA threonylcarbamoyladenosine biosynthesis protein TsaE
VIRLDTVDATLRLGVCIGKQLRAGDLVILGGSLGAGKTTLTKGIATGMGVSGRVTSPTFVIARVHRPDAGSGRAIPLVHVDAYRLAGALELDDLDLDTDLDAAAVVIEWGEGVAERLSSERLTIELTRLPDDTRTAELVAVGEHWQARAQAVVSAVADSVGAGSPYGSE